MQVIKMVRILILMPLKNSSNLTKYRFSPFCFVTFEGIYTYSICLIYIWPLYEMLFHVISLDEYITKFFSFMCPFRDGKSQLHVFCSSKQHLPLTFIVKWEDRYDITFQHSLCFVSNKIFLFTNTLFNFRKTFFAIPDLLCLAIMLLHCPDSCISIPA